jgi:hypothetical protein
MLSLAALPPSGDVIDEQLAGVILQHWRLSSQRPANAHIIAQAFGTSADTVMRIVSHFETTGAVRVPQPGTGKKDDPRWFFAGSRGPGNLRRLEEAHAAGKPDDLVVDVRQRYMEDGHGGAPALSTVGTALLHKLDLTVKLITKRALERDDAACARWIARVKAMYESRQLLFIDETCVPPRPRPPSDPARASSILSPGRRRLRANLSLSLSLSVCTQPRQQQDGQPSLRPRQAGPAREGHSILPPRHGVLGAGCLQPAGHDGRAHCGGRL